MEVRSVLSADKNYKVEVTEKYTFDSKSNYEQYKQLFNGMKETGYVNAHSFDDFTWYLPCPVTFKNIQINFDIGGYNSFIPSIKSYVLLKRKSGLKPRTIIRDLMRLKEAIISTNGLRGENIVKEYLLDTKWDTNEIYRVCSALVNYLSFYPIPKITGAVSEVFDGLKYPEFNNRELPPVQDVLTFDDCVNRYFTENPIEETLRFYPIFLWWTITNIIPMRPIEFLRIKTDCLEIKSDGSYWITILRHKLKSSSPDEVTWEQTVPIDKKTYEVVRNYLLWSEKLGENPNLIPPLDWINERFRGSRTVNEYVTNTIDLNTLIRFFYEEVVQEKYGEFGLSRITAGDTRHFAIINLFLQGFNILSITRLSGHEEITSPGNYYTHAEHYATSFVYKLAQKKLEDDISSSMADGFIGLKGKQVWQAKSGIITDEETEKWRKVDYGFCSDSEFPANCVEDCRLCEPHYIFKPSVNEWNEGIKWLDSQSKALGENITKTIDLMAMVSSNTYGKILEGIEKLNENEGKSLAIQLFKYLDHKAIIEARIMEEKYKDE